MPWEVTIRSATNDPLGDMDSVVAFISAAVPGIEWYREPSLLEQIKQYPDHPFHKLLPTWTEEEIASSNRSRLLGHLDAGDISMRLYGFESEPIAVVCAEFRGDGNPVPLLAAICSPQGWIATDDRDGQLVDLAGETSIGWEHFREYRNRVIRDVESDDH